jgi:hypothetical protein
MKFSLTAIALLLAGVAAALVMPARGKSPGGMPQPELHWGTDVERRDSLEAMREVWINRDRANAVANRLDERRFIFRLNFFTRYLRGTETFGDATSLLVTAYRENAAAYGEINGHGGR